MAPQCILLKARHTSLHRLHQLICASTCSTSLLIASVAGADTHNFNNGLPAVSLPDSGFEPVADQAALPPLAFVPFEMLNPADGKPLDASQSMFLPNGRRVNVGDYFRDLNSQEAYLNKLGRTLREYKNLGTLERSKNNPSAEKNQLELQQSLATKPGVAPEFGMTEAFRAARAGNPTGNLAVACNTNGVTPKDSRVEKPMNRFVGDKQFGTFSDGNFVLEGSATDVNSASSYGAGVQFFQARTDLYRVNHTVSTHVGNKKAGFDTTLYVLGKQVFRRSNSGENISEKMGSRLWSKSVEIPGPAVAFNLGPIPLKVDSKVKGTVAVDWGVQGKNGSAACNTAGNNAEPVGLGAFIEPSLDATGIVTGGVDASIGRAGVGGDIQLVNDKLTVSGSIALAPGTGIFLEYISIDNVIDALAGRLYAYAEILVPTAKRGIFAQLFKQTRWEKELYAWKGYHAEGNIYRYEPKPK